MVERSELQRDISYGAHTKFSVCKFWAFFDIFFWDRNGLELIPYSGYYDAGCIEDIDSHP